MNIFGLGLPELIVIALILLLFFGPKRLPSLFRSIGSSIRELKQGLNEKDKESEDTKTTTTSNNNPSEPNNTPKS